ncbi:MAG TPA: hypothetical protein VE685_10420, partial [Thermoanaerobaculia bacterium]|nr:hypothetical protein [Thermoanaerobaculia bacterium]
MTKRSALLLPALLLLVLPALADISLGPSALEPPETGGVEVVDRALAKLSTHKRLLVVAAHPDDEDTSLIAL